MRCLLVFVIVCIAFLTVGCKKDDSTSEPQLDVNKLSITLDGSFTSTDTIRITSNTSWTASVDQSVDWMLVSPSVGTGNKDIIISTFEKNTSGSTRAAILTITTNTGSKSVQVTVTQNSFDDAISRGVFGGEDFDAFSAFTNTQDGGYIAVGHTTSTLGDATGGRGNPDLWLVKFDNTGSKVWHRIYGGSGHDFAHSILRISGGRYLVLGSTNSIDGDISLLKGQTDAWVMEIDDEGNMIWEKTIGGSADDWLFNIKSAGNGDYLMSGWTRSTDQDVIFNHGGSDAWLVKINGSGEVFWEKTFGGSADDYAYDATPVSDGGYIFCGQGEGNDGDHADRSTATPAAWLVKLNSQGELRGKRYMGATVNDFANIAIEAFNGDYIFAGQTQTPSEFPGYHANVDAFVCRLNAGGNFIWKKAYGGSAGEIASDIAATAGDGFVFTGVTASNDGDVSTNHGAEDGWVLKLDGDGNIVSSLTYGGGLNDNISQVLALNNDQFAFVGRSENFEDLFPDLSDISHGWFQVVTVR